MSTQQVIAFWQRVQNDEQLQKRIDPSGGEVPRLHAGIQASELGALCKIAEEAGFTCSADELAAVEAVMRFWDKVQRDEQLQKKLKPAEEMESPEDATAEVVRIAGEAGFQFTAEQLDAVTKAQIEASGELKGEELSDQELEQVAGGYYSFQRALSGGWAPNFRRVGPGLSAEYM